MGQATPPTALVLVAHGDRGGSEPNRVLLEQAHRVAGRGTFATVRAGVLNGEPSIEAALAGLDGHEIVVFPFFMSDGYFTGRLVPDRLDAVVRREGWRPPLILPPLGLHPGLVDILLAMTRREVDGRRITVDCPLILAAHGAASNDMARLAIEDLQTAVRERLPPARQVLVGYLEEAPFLADTFGSVATPAICVGAFASNGMHSAEDVPGLIRAAGRHGEIIFAGSLGAEPAVADLIHEAARAATAGFNRRR